MPGGIEKREKEERERGMVGWVGPFVLMTSRPGLTCKGTEADEDHARNV